MKDYKEQFIWKKAKDLAIIIYKLTKHYPEQERYGLVSQMTRCAVSIPSNIAEGYAKPSTKEYIRFLYIALVQECRIKSAECRMRKP